MGRKGWQGDKFAHAAHIKRHTKGTSNEISFSVLDAAKLAMEDGKDQLSNPSLLGRIPLFTLSARKKKVASTPAKEQELVLPGGDPVQADTASAVPQAVSPVAAPPPGEPASTAVVAAALSPARGVKKDKTRGETPSVSREIEIARRKARRRLYRICGIAFVVVVSVCLLGAAGSYLYQGHQEHMGYVNELSAALDEVAEVDEFLVDMDAVLANPTEQSLEKLESLQSDIVASRTQLEQAKDHAANAVAGMRDSTTDKEAAGNATVAINARMTMLDEGEAMIDAAIDFIQASEELEEAWASVVEGDSLVRDAARLVSEFSMENIISSREKTQAAIAVFQQAQDRLDALAGAYPQLDLRTQQTYLEKRLEAQQHALASDDAILAEDTATAAAENEAYNAAEAEAVSLAKDLPDDPSSPARDVYASEVENPAGGYEEARAQAAAADAFLREYFGSSGK